MLWKFLILIAGVWCSIYTVSYGVFEYKNKNTPGATAVFILGFLIAVASAGITFFGLIPMG